MFNEDFDPLETLLQQELKLSKFIWNETNAHITINEALLDLSNKMNDLITACSSQIVTLAPSGTFPLASFFTSVTPLIPTQQLEIENITILQGDGS